MHRSRVGDRFGLDSDLMTMSAVPQFSAQYRQRNL